MMKELCTREAYDESPSTAGQKKTFREVVETPQKPKSTTLDSPPAADTLAPPPAVPEVHEDEKEEPTEKPAGDADTQGEPPDTAMKPGASSSSRGEKRTETQEATFVKKTVDNEVINREVKSHVCRRACQTKTDGEKQTRRTTTCSCQWRAWIRICSTR